MSHSEAQVLRNELALLVTEGRRKDGIIEQQGAEIIQLRADKAHLAVSNKQMAAKIEHLELENKTLKSGDAGAKIEHLELENKMLKSGDAGAKIEHLELENKTLKSEKEDADRQLEYYNNPHSPSSQNSLPTRTRKAKNRKDPSEYKRSGRKPGHEGVSHARKSEKTNHYCPEDCPKCGSTRIKRGDMKDMRVVLETPPPPKASLQTHVAHEGTCGGCGHVIPAPSLYEDGLGVAVRGTSFGPNLAAYAVRLWTLNMSDSGATEMINDLFGTGLCRTAIQKARIAVGKALQGEYDRIKAALAHASLLKADETTYVVMGVDGYVWVVIGGDVILIEARTTRAALVMDDLAPYYDTPITCDGYAGYNMFKIIQRCWAHLLREAEPRGPGMPEIEALDRSLNDLYSRAEGMQRKSEEDPEVDTGPMEAEAEAIASEYERRGLKFGGKLRRAIPKLFTFVNIPDMDGTNNESERAMRTPVIFRKIRYRIVSNDGARAFSNTLTCVMTWKKRGLNVTDMLLAVLKGT